MDPVGVVVGDESAVFGEIQVWAWQKELNNNNCGNMVE